MNEALQAFQDRVEDAIRCLRQDASMRRNIAKHQEAHNRVCAERNAAVDWANRLLQLITRVQWFVSPDRGDTSTAEVRLQVVRNLLTELPEYHEPNVIPPNPLVG